MDHRERGQHHRVTRHATNLGAGVERGQEFLKVPLPLPRLFREKRPAPARKEEPVPADRFAMHFAGQWESALFFFHGSLHVLVKKRLTLGNALEYATQLVFAGYRLRNYVVQCG